jgi:hypothetical protein
LHISKVLSSSVFADFVRTGRLGPLSLSMAAADVQAALGPPDAQSMHRPTIWTYYDLQVAFDQNRVILIALYPTGPAIQLPVLMSASMLTTPIERDVLLRELSAAGVELLVDTALTFEGDQTTFVPIGGVRLTFNENDELVKVIASAWGTSGKGDATNGIAQGHD